MMVYGILHVAADETSAYNVKLTGFQDQIELYFKNAVLLAESLKLHGIGYTLLTNRADTLRSISYPLGRNIDILEIPCATPVPSGMKFYSAHFKIDALNYMASSSDDYAMLCDLDMICINAVPRSLRTIVAKNIPLFYDISDQVIAAYGHDTIIADLNRIAGIDCQGRWAGGEFIAGPPAFLGELHAMILRLWPAYLHHAPDLHHIGDEAVVSAALERMVAGGARICDAGTLGIVSRFWSGAIRHHQRPLAHYRGNFLLHLPADKRLLASFAPNQLPGFLARYRSYLKRKRPYNLSNRLLKRLRSSLRKVAN